MNTRVRAKPRPSEARPHPNARAVYQHVEAYLAGALNEEALEAWRLRVGKGLAAGRSLDDVIRRLCEASEAADALAEHAVILLGHCEDGWEHCGHTACQDARDALYAYRQTAALASPERSEGDAVGAAGALGGTPDGRGESGATNARRREA